MRIACVGKVRPATVTLPQARWKERVYALSGASSGGGGGPGALGRLLGTVTWAGMWVDIRREGIRNSFRIRQRRHPPPCSLRRVRLLPERVVLYWRSALPPRNPVGALGDYVVKSLQISRL
jgi:hypothetical protein